jgi:hypothetical protein
LQTGQSIYYNGVLPSKNRRRIFDKRSKLDFVYFHIRERLFPSYKLLDGKKQFRQLKFLPVLILFSCPALRLNAQPVGCSASTGPNVSTIVLQHPEARYQLLVTKWSDIEPQPDQFNFVPLKTKVQTIKSYGKKYAFAVGLGGPGTPAWVVDSLHVPYLSYLFRGTTPYRLPLWWDSLLQVRLTKMINRAGSELGSDTSLVLVYITQMTANGNEGHLQFVNMDSLRLLGFTPQRWIDAATRTAKDFAAAFPGKPLAFEVHDFENSSVIPQTIINNLYSDSTLQKRVGAALWWLSGKTTYQANLLNFLKTFQGNKYAQLIAHSGQPDRFADSNIATAFAQAKELKVRYIEPWYEEYASRRIDTLLHDFNIWADAAFAPTAVEGTSVLRENDFQLYQNYPNPFNPRTRITYILPSRQYVQLTVYDLLGNEIAMLVNSEQTAGKHSVEFSSQPLASGMYFYSLKTSSRSEIRKMVLVR